jgi:hypothetical protein
MSDEDMEAMPYADLWLAELGPVVRGYRHAEQERANAAGHRKHAARSELGVFAPDPMHGRGRG